MTFDDYQKAARKTALYPTIGRNFVYPALGLSGETGEVLEKIKKLFRDKNSQVTDEFKIELAKELGDVLWYISQICSDLEISLEDVAQTCIKKINSRYDRNVIKGDGDNR